MSRSPLTHLQRLEAESIQIFREAAAECENQVMLYSIGKDSATMLHLARKAFLPVSDLTTTDIAEYLRHHEHKGLLRFITYGSANDGKSTLIGRLLYESKMLFEDQLAAGESEPVQGRSNARFVGLLSSMHETATAPTRRTCLQRRKE